MLCPPKRISGPEIVLCASVRVCTARAIINLTATLHCNHWQPTCCAVRAERGCILALPTVRYQGRLVPFCKVFDPTAVPLDSVDSPAAAEGAKQLRFDDLLVRAHADVIALQHATSKSASQRTIQRGHPFKGRVGVP